MRPVVLARIVAAVALLALLASGLIGRSPGPEVAKADALAALQPAAD